MLKLIVLLLVIAAGLGWHFKQDLNDQFELVDEKVFADMFGEHTALNTDIGSNSEIGNVAVVSNNEAAKQPELIDNQPSKVEPMEDLKSAAAKIDDTSQMLSTRTEITSEITASVTDNAKEVSSVNIEKTVNNNASENNEGKTTVNATAQTDQEAVVIVAKAVGPTLNPEINSKPIASEKVVISAAKSTNSVNLASSIKTQSNHGASVKVSSTEISTESAINQFIDGWMGAWQKQDFDGYQQFYSDRFKSGGQSTHARWLKWRKKRIERPKWIKLSRSNIKYQSQEQTKLYQIQLTLMYSSPNYRDKTFKRMTIEKLNDSTFKIVKEENLKVTKI